MKVFLFALSLWPLLATDNAFANVGYILDAQESNYARAQIHAITLAFCDQVGIKAYDCKSEFLAKKDFWPAEFWRDKRHRIDAKLMILETGGRKGWLNTEGKFLLEENARRNWEPWQPTETSKANERKSKDGCADEDNSDGLAQHWLRTLTINQACFSYRIGAQACLENFYDNERFYRQCFDYQDSNSALRDIIEWATKNGYRYHSRSLGD